MIEKRGDALDALRGFAILTMILSGSIPFSGIASLPGWMYHAQVPPPEHIFNPNLPGITWVDLVFPFFLFSMGAAFPFSLRNRLEQGIPKWKTSLQIFQRGVLLAFFAIFLQHVKPHALSGEPNNYHWVIGLSGFVVLFIIFLRYPTLINKFAVYGLRTLGLTFSIILMSTLIYSDGSGFSLNRSNIIILVLANVAISGSLIWLFTQKSILPKIFVLGLLLAFRITHNIDNSWTHWVWEFTPFNWLYKFYYHQYLFIVIPGMLAGDLLYKFNKSEPDVLNANDKYKFVLLLLVSIGIVLANLFGLYNRLLIVNLFTNTLLIIIGLLLIRQINGSIGIFYKNIFYTSVIWLILGLCFEPYENGIKKDPSTLSYYLVTSGLAGFSLITFSIIIDYFKKKKWVQLLIDNGQNPMIAYISGSNIVMPILALTGLSTILNYLLINPWFGFLKGLIFTLLCALVTSLFTKKKLFWRT